MWLHCTALVLDRAHAGHCNARDSGKSSGDHRRPIDAGETVSLIPTPFCSDMPGCVHLQSFFLLTCYRVARCRLDMNTKQTLVLFFFAPPRVALLRDNSD